MSGTTPAVGMASRTGLRRGLPPQLARLLLELCAAPGLLCTPYMHRPGSNYLAAAGECWLKRQEEWDGSTDLR